MTASKPACILFRFLETDLEYVINHAQDTYVMLDTTYLGLVQRMHARLPSVNGYILLANREDMPADSPLPHLFCYEDLLQVPQPYFSHDVANSLKTRQTLTHSSYPNKSTSSRGF